LGRCRQRLRQGGRRLVEVAERDPLLVARPALDEHRDRTSSAAASDPPPDSAWTSKYHVFPIRTPSAARAVFRRCWLGWQRPRPHRPALHDDREIVTPPT